MTDLAALHRAILLQPHEDAPRLMYADALDSLDPQRIPCQSCLHKQPARCKFCNGDGTSDDYHSRHRCVYCDGRGVHSPECRTCNSTGSIIDPINAARAEFIRLSIEKSRNPEPFAGDGRLRELLSFHGKGFVESQWVGVITDGPLKLLTKVGMGCTFDRGFVSSVDMKIEVFRMYATTIFAAHPITYVHLTDVIGAHSVTNQRTEYRCYFHRLGKIADHYGIPWDQTSYDASEDYDRLAARLSRACVRYGRSLAGLPTEVPV